jgi:hypothetical protein
VRPSPPFAKVVANERLVARIGRAVYEWGLPWPQLSSDPDQQWLVCEAIAAAWHAKRQQEQQQEQARLEALEEGQRRIAEWKAERGM